MVDCTAKFMSSLDLGSFLLLQVSRTCVPTCVGLQPCAVSARAYAVGPLLLPAEASAGKMAAPFLALRVRHAGLNQRAVELKTYIVEDNATIRENLIGALEELA